MSYDFSPRWRKRQLRGIRRDRQQHRRCEHGGAIGSASGGAGIARRLSGEWNKRNSQSPVSFEFTNRMAGRDPSSSTIAPCDRPINSSARLRRSARISSVAYFLAIQPIFGRITAAVLSQLSSLLEGSERICFGVLKRTDRTGFFR